MSTTTNSADPITHESATFNAPEAAPPIEELVHHPDSPDDAVSGDISPAQARVIKRLYHGLIDSWFARMVVTLLQRLLPPPHVGLTYHDIAAPGLPPRLDGLRVLHISDLHLRPGSPLALELPALVADVPHDLLLYTGDFIDDDDGIDHVGGLLARMPTTAPRYAVLGNHDYYPLGRERGRNDVPRLKRMLAHAKVDLMTNASRTLYDGDLYLVGLDDPCTKHDDLTKAIAAVPDDACTIMLVHSPDMVKRLRGFRPALMLSGHTHGGQIRLPWIGPLITMSNLPRRAVMGLFSYAGVQVFVTRGIGYSGLDIRINCPAEATVLTLRSTPR